MAGILGWLGVGRSDDGRHQPNPNYQNPNPAGAVAAPYSSTTQGQPHASVINSDTQNMKGLVNNTGYTKGDGNGSMFPAVGIPVGPKRQTEYQNIKGLSNQTGSINGDANGLINLGTVESQPRPNDTPKQSEEDQWNTKPTNQNIKGLSNQTGSITGSANGLINLGEYTQCRP